MNEMAKWIGYAVMGSTGLATTVFIVGCAGDYFLKRANLTFDFAIWYLEVRKKK